MTNIGILWHLSNFTSQHGNVAPALTKQGMLYVLAGERIVRELRKEVFQALLRQEVAYFDVQTTGAPWLNSKRCGGMSPV